MSFPLKVQDHALAITGNVYMSSTTKFIRSTSQANNNNRRLTQTTQLPTHSQEKQIAKPDPAIISRKKQQNKTINNNDLQRNAHLSPANAVKGSENKSQKSASEIAMHISANIFLNATTKFVKGYQTLGKTQKNNDKQKTQKNKSLSPKSKQIQHNVNVNIKPPINTVKKPIIQKKQVQAINNSINNQTKYNPYTTPITVTPKPSGLTKPSSPPKSSILPNPISPPKSSTLPNPLNPPKPSIISNPISPPKASILSPINPPKPLILPNPTNLPKSSIIPNSISSTKPLSPPKQKPLLVVSPPARPNVTKNPENIVKDNNISKNSKIEVSLKQTTKIVKPIQKQKEPTPTKLSPTHRIARNQQNDILNETKSNKKETSPKSAKKSESPRNPSTNAYNMAGQMYLNSTTKFVKNIDVSSQHLTHLNISPAKRQKSPIRQPAINNVSPASKSSVGLEVKRNEQTKPQAYAIRNRFQSETIKQNANTAIATNEGTKRIERKRENARQIKFVEQKKQIIQNPVPTNQKAAQQKSKISKPLEKQKPKQPSPQIKENKTINTKYPSIIPSPQKNDTDKNKYTYPIKTDPKTPKSKYIANFSNQQSQIGQNNANSQGLLIIQKDALIQRKPIVVNPSIKKKEQLTQVSKSPRSVLNESAGQISEPTKNDITNRATYKTVQVTKQTQNSKEQPIVSKQSSSQFIKAKSDKNITQKKQILDRNQAKKIEQSKSIEPVRKIISPPSINPMTKTTEIPSASVKLPLKTQNFKSIDPFDRVWAQTTRPKTSFQPKVNQKNQINAIDAKSTIKPQQKNNNIKSSQSQISTKQQKPELNVTEKSAVSKLQKLGNQSKLLQQQKNPQNQSSKIEPITSITEPIRSPYKREPINKVAEKKQESKIQPNLPQKAIIQPKEAKKQQQTQNNRKIIRRTNEPQSPKQAQKNQITQKQNNLKFVQTKETPQIQKREAIASPSNRNIRTTNNSIIQTNTKADDSNKNINVTANPIKTTPNGRLSSTSIAQQLPKIQNKKQTVANQVYEYGNKKNISTAVSPIKQNPSDSATSIAQPLTKTQIKRQTSPKPTVQLKKQSKDQQQQRKTATNLTNSQTQANSQKKISNLKRSQLLIYAIGKIFHKNKEFAFKNIQRRSKQLKIKSKQSIILILQVSSFAANLISNNLKTSFNQLKKNLQQFNKSNKIVQLNVAVNKERAANIITRLLSQKMWDNFAYLRMFNWFNQHLIPQVSSEKEAQVDKGSRQKQLRSRQLLTLINILKNYNKTKLRSAFDKIYTHSFSGSAKHKSLNTNILPNSIKRQIAPSRSPQKPQRNYQNERKVLKETKAQLQSQLSKMQLSFGERKRSIDYERGKLIKKMQQLIKKVKNLENQVLRKRTRIKQLEGVVNSLEKGDFQIQLPQGQPLIQILTQMYTQVFKSQNQMIDKDKFINLFSLNKDQCNSVIDVWKSLTKNIQLKADIANWEGTQTKHYKVKQNFQQEQKIQTMVVRSYIRERYLWEWVHESVQKL